jgi:hypothetical protein
MSNKHVSFTAKSREQFREAYEQAKKNNDEQFVFLGNTFVTNYAKYVLEYLDMQRLG